MEFTILLAAFNFVSLAILSLIQANWIDKLSDKIDDYKASMDDLNLEVGHAYASLLDRIQDGKRITEILRADTGTGPDNV